MNNRSLKVISGGRDDLVKELRRMLYEIVINPDQDECEALEQRLWELDRRLSRKASLKLVRNTDRG